MKKRTIKSHNKEIKNNTETVHTNEHTLRYEFSNWPFEDETVEEFCDLI